jgi:two-component system, NarL family, sensor kinase
MENEIRFYFGIIIAMLTFVIMAGGFILVFIRYQKKIALKQQELFIRDAQYKQELLLNSIESAETERMRIAKDIHDEIGSIFSTLSLSINRLNSEQSLPSEHFLSSKNLIESGINSVRRISHAIVPFELELLGLEQTLASYFETIESVSQIDISFHSSYSLDLLTKSTSLAIYRVMQELSSNCLKYAKAKHIDIHIDSVDGEITIRYTDDGIGVNLEDLISKKGIGLKNIESRVILMNGAVIFRSNPGEGFCCSITIPLNKNTGV